MRDPRLVDQATHGPTPSPEQLEHARQLATRIARDTPSAAALDEAMEALREEQGAVWQAWYSAFGDVVGGDPSRRSAWAHRLLAEVDGLLAQPDELARFSNDRAMMRREVDDWQRTKDPAEAWHEGQSHVIFDLNRLFFYLELLLRIDLRAWCEVLDRLPNPGVMHIVLSLRPIGEDRDLIVALLEHAPPVLDDRGRWLPSRSVAALLVAKQIVNHAVRLRFAGGERPFVVIGQELEGGTNDALEADLKAWFERAFTALVARDDGIPLGILVLAKLARDDLFRSPYGSGEHVTSNYEALRALARCLARRGCTVATIRQSSERAAELSARETDRSSRARNSSSPPRGEGAPTLAGGGIPYLHGASLVLGEAPATGSPATEELLELWSWARELLRGADEALRLITPGTAPSEDFTQRLGCFLSLLDEPDRRWTSAYTELEPRRRRSQFSSRYEEISHDRESIVLIKLGLYTAVVWKARDATQTEPARRLFWAIYREARRLWLTERRYDHERTKEHLVASCFAFMPALFGEELERALAMALPPIANDAWLVAHAANTLVRNNVEPRSLLPSFAAAGAPLDTALRDAKQWASIVDEPLKAYQSVSTEFPPRLAELAQALGLVLDQADASDPTHEQLLASFTREIPWAAVLHDRMAHDGLELEWLVPLADRREWLLQVSIPEPLREAFGLAPQLRVLVVHGQVRGQMLRWATQHPRASEHIDPDLLVISSDQLRLESRLPNLAGPWGQRVAWPAAREGLMPLERALAEQLPRFDVFDYRDPVRGRALIGREREIEDIAARLVRGEAIGVLGLRKVGKSSLMRAVVERLDPIGARLGMFESLAVPLPLGADAEALVVSIDVQSLARREVGALADRLARELEERLSYAGVLAPSVQSRAPDEGHGADALARFDALVSLALDRTEQPLCFVFDEYDLLFEGYDGQPGITGVQHLLSNLRARSQSTQRVSLAFVGRDPAFLQQPQIGGVTSPLPMRTKIVFLGPLRRDGAEELLVRLGRRVGLAVGPRTLKAAWCLTGGHPLLLRQLGSELVEHAKDSGLRQSDALVDRVTASFSSREVVYTLCSEVDTLLRMRYPAARALLERLSVRRGDGERVEEAYDRQLLLRLGLLVDERPHWVPEIFRAWFGGADVALERGA